MAEVKVLVKGWTTADNPGGKESTCATISLIKDEKIAMVVDPGILKDPQALISSLAQENLKPEEINYVALTHSHADHFKNIGLFSNAKLLEFYGIWFQDTVEDWQEQFSKNIKIIKTPGHANTSISFLVNTKKGVVAVVGDVFWKEDLPVIDPYADNPKLLEKSRKKIIEIADWIIPGHADIYKNKSKKSK
jgi:glyoxylase-like metal-dependent hydrolase (beta-lactamase superfamily II)